MRGANGWAAIAAMAMAGTAAAQDAAPAQGDTAPVDYARPASWICRPGVDDGTCSGDLDAMTVDPAGERRPAPYVPAKAPPIDCFYVYPTVSDDPTFYSDVHPDASERRAVHNQAARLGAVCRLFVPAYHQMTSAGLRWRMSDRGRTPDGVAGAINAIPYRDILAAWRSYLQHDNQGRGVVLVGHSQGAILLKKLVAEEIDGKPAQRRLVAAYLAGNPDLTTASFKAIPPCGSTGQTGCVVAWSSYPDDMGGQRWFGGGRPGAPICVNPAAPNGGRATLKAFLPRPALAPAGDPPYVESVGQLTAECVRDANGAVLRIRVEPGRYAEVLRGMLHLLADRTPAGWGLHPLDISLVQGNMIDLIGTQSAAYLKQGR